jgi:hypothetical protein
LKLTAEGVRMAPHPDLFARIDQGIRALADDGLIPNAIRLNRDDMAEAMARFRCPTSGRLLNWPAYRGFAFRRASKGPSVVIGLAPCAPRRERQVI